MRKLKGTLIMIGECVRMSLSNIRGSKVRSFLTVLGIMIGVTAVIALITTVNGVTGSISDSFLSMGAGTLTVSVSGVGSYTGGAFESGKLIFRVKEGSTAKEPSGTRTDISDYSSQEMEGLVQQMTNQLLLTILESPELMDLFAEFYF